MTKGEGKAEVIDLKGLLARDDDFVRAAVEALDECGFVQQRSEIRKCELRDVRGNLLKQYPAIDILPDEAYGCSVG